LSDTAAYGVAYACTNAFSDLGAYSCADSCADRRTGRLLCDELDRLHTVHERMRRRAFVAQPHYLPGIERRQV
jgi:hypothetical protein